MKTKATKLIAYLACVGALVVGGVSFAEDVLNVDTGADSVNVSSIKVENGTEIKVENNAAIDNKIDLNIDTGDNTANGNTGDGAITSGDIDVSLDVTNEVNYCSINGDDIDDPDNNDLDGTTTTTTKSTTTVVTTPSGGTITITTTGTGVKIHTSGYSGSLSTTLSADGVEESIVEPDESDNEIIALNNKDVKGTEAQNVLVGDEQNCPWCIAIVIALAIILGGYGFYLSRAENPRGFLKYWYLWPAVLGYLAWIIHTIAHYGTGIGWFADGYDKIIIAEIIISYLAYYFILVRHEHRIHKAI